MSSRDAQAAGPSGTATPAAEGEHHRGLPPDILATLAHEVRSPINGMVLTLQLLRVEIGKNLTEREEELIGRLGQQVRDLQAAVDTALEITHLDAGYRRCCIEEVDLRALFVALEQECRSAHASGGLAFTRSVSPDLAPLRTDRAKLTLALKNLLQSGSHPTRNGGITLRAETVGERVLISVSDPELGFTPELPAAVADTGTEGERSYPIGRVGLRLYLSRRLIELLGGTLSVERDPAQGTTFRISLVRRVE